MGNSCEVVVGKKKGKFTLPSNKNHYSRTRQPNSKEEQEHVMRIYTMICPNIKADENSTEQLKELANYLENCSGEIFTDPHFEQLQASLDPKKQKYRLSTLYNLERSHINKVYRSSPTPYAQLKQNEIQFTYLTTVLYFLCQHSALKEHILHTQHVNQFQVYVVELFCGGQRTRVVLDDFLPMHKERFKYSEVGKGEIWPVLVEKAWCKQIGSYDRAKGLSPEDAFEQITGFPSKSYLLQNLPLDDVSAALQQAMVHKLWVSFTASAGRELQNRQVFYLESCSDSFYYLRSPYLSHRPKQNESQLIKMTLSQVYSYFEFMTIGYYMDGYHLHSFPITSHRRTDKLFELKVTKEEKINIRFIQLYAGYFSEHDAVTYDYSPVFIELYNHHDILVVDCEGCNSSIEGNRASNISEELFVQLKPGTYHIRLEVDWLNQAVLNKGNLVVYATKNNVSLQELTQEEMEKVLPRLIVNNLDLNQEKPALENYSQGVRVRTSDKKFRYVMGIENISDENSNLNIMLKDSENIRVKFQKVVKDKQDLCLKATLEPRKQLIMEIVPEDTKKPFSLKPFQIQKLKHFD